ncbi:MAG: permease-like cell division protein FtsX [Actinomycetota bacterium]|nr:permease-like cell division protein FtsX [Actinomycetota bacterium]MDI6821486.1 permease-like cell division protein FtsX [Actinomycetota bacterium]
MRIRIFYFIREALTSFKRNWVMSIAAASTVAVCLILVGAVVILALIVGNIIRGLESKVEVQVFLKDSTPTSEVKTLQNEILSWSEVSKVYYISKEEAWERLKKDLKDQPELLEAVSGNPLPASLEIRLKNPRLVASTVRKIKQRSGIHNLVDDLERDIKYGQKVIPKFFKVTWIIRVVGGIIIAVLCFASLVLIANTIRLAIFARRKEIAIMKLVGASNWFIRWPFLLEGILQGLIGAVAAILVLYIARLSLISKAKEALPFLPISFSEVIFWKLMLILTLAGILIGVTGSAIALRKFLRV